MTYLPLGLVWLAVSLGYLANRHQRLLARPLAGWPVGGLAAALLVAGLWWGVAQWGWASALLSALVLAMLWAGALPLLALWGPGGRARPAADRAALSAAESLP
jgi:hypothetical protein